MQVKNEHVAYYDACIGVIHSQVKCACLLLKVQAQKSSHAQRLKKAKGIIMFN